MKGLIKYGCMVALAGLAIGADAQDLEMGYFNKGFIGQQVLNPALQGEYNMVSMPALGGMHFGLRGNMSVPDFIFNRNGRTVTFMTEAVSVADFLKGVKGRNRTNFDSYLRVLGTGFKA